MPIFLICIIVFIIWFRVKLKQNNSTRSEADISYWEREQNANFARTQDISHLDYLCVDYDKLPFSSAPTEDEMELEEKIKSFGNTKMLNLIGLSNTDLKEQYGPANLDVLTEYDQNFTDFIRTLNQWGNLLDQKKENDRAKQVLEYAVSIGSDISTSYTLLGELYAKEGFYDKVDSLIQTVESSQFTLKASIIRNLKLAKLKY